MEPLTVEQIKAIDKRFNAGEIVWMWAIHHSVRVEILTERLSERIRYIREEKPPQERETRLRWLQPVKNVRALPLWLTRSIERVYGHAGPEVFAVPIRYWEPIAESRLIAEQHERECPGVPWAKCPSQEGMILPTDLD